MKVLIIGNKGSYGSWISNTVSNCISGYEVKGIDKEETGNITEFIELIKNHSIIISAVSLSASRRIIRLVMDNVAENYLVIDIASSKKEIHLMFNEAKCDYVMMHPMCAPPEIGYKLADSKKIYCINNGKLSQNQNSLFYNSFVKAFGGKIVGMSIEHHNVLEEVNQSVPHNILLAFASSVITGMRNSGLSYQDFKNNATPVSKPLYDSLERFLSKGNSETTAYLIWLSMKYHSKPFFSANKSILDNQSIGMPKYVEKLTDRIERIKGIIFDSDQ